ncbi:hypothetical protein FDECE_14937 [Fusarium decemcellulare]|nr:hypothetical protein FDECE_14937 [Fusarium decemcellulare]
MQKRRFSEHCFVRKMSLAFSARAVLCVFDKTWRGLFLFVIRSIIALDDHIDRDHDSGTLVAITRVRHKARLVELIETRYPAPDPLPVPLQKPVSLVASPPGTSNV